VFKCKYENAEGLCGMSGTRCEKNACAGFYNKCSFCLNDCKQSNNVCKEENKFYAVRIGRIPGVYSKFTDCRHQTDGVANADYKIFYSFEEAAEYVKNGQAQKAVSASKKNETAKKETVESERKEAYAYVDGSYNQYTKTYGYGGFLVADSKHILKGCGKDPEMATMRNVAGELLGASVAIQMALKLGVKVLTIYYDYAGIEAWPTGKWQANKKGTIAYRDYCIRCQTKHGLKIKFKKVKGHSGIEGNEEADILAKQAVGLA